VDRKVRILQDGKTIDVAVKDESPRADCEFCAGKYFLAVTIELQYCLLHSAPTCAVYDASSAAEFIQKSVEIKEKRRKEQMN